jgi:hypothetical protein
MKRARRIARRIVLTLVLLGLVALALLNYVLLPQYGGPRVKAELEKFLGRTVRFEHIEWNVFRGATITGLVVEHRGDLQSETPFLEAERVQAHFRITSLIPLRIEIRPDLQDVTVRLIRTAGREWNVADIIERLSRTPEKTPTVRVARLGLSGARFTIEDRYAGLPEQSLEAVSGLLTAPAGALNHLKLAGRWSGAGGQVTLGATFGADVPPLFTVQLSDTAIRQLQQLLAPDEGILVHDVAGRVTATITRTAEGKLAGTAQIAFDRSALEIEDFHITGPVSGPLEFTVTPGDETALAISGTLRLVGGTVRYIPKPEMQPASEEIADELTDVDRAPLADQRVEVAAQRTAPADEEPLLTAEGDATVGLLVAGTAGEQLSITVACELGHMTARTPAVHAPIEIIRGHVTYDGTGLAYQNVVGTIEGAVITINGAIDAFGDEPNMTFDVQGQRLGGNAQLKLRRVENQDLPAFQIDGSFWADAALARFVLPPEAAEALDRLQLTGMVGFEGQVARVEPGIKNVRARGEISGRGLGVRGFGFEGFSGTLYIERGLLKAYGLDAVLYDGRFTGAWEADFSAEGRPFKLDAALRDVEIAKLPLLTNVENRQLHGRLGFKVNVNGRLDDLEKNIGKGKFKLRQGYVWEFDVFNELFKVISLRVPSLAKVVFDEAQGDFRVEGLALTTHNLYFKSPLLQLLMDGSVDLHGKLDVVVDPVFFRERGGPIQRLVRSVLNVAANVIPRVIVKGTVTKPVVKPYLRPRLPILKEIIR